MTEHGPTRIQRRRTAGWRSLGGAVYVGPPDTVGQPLDGHHQRRQAGDEPGGSRRALPTPPGRSPELITAARGDLAGRNLVCWCSLDHLCHADVLLEILGQLDDERGSPPGRPAVAGVARPDVSRGRGNR
ncbi:MAG: DUF4326 domain-containing protein [Actinomycetota bacterium]|nr:DUF4326 domain-containing protein [Actinomycetota bacterium]